MKQKFRDWKPTGASEERLAQIITIIENYGKQGYTLTLRQLYYQLVTKNIVPNKPAEYGNLSKLLMKARMAGLVDWTAIEDRIRRPYLPYWCIDPADAIIDAENHYRVNRQDGQDVYVELWVEKDALSGVLKKITAYYHINLMVNRGYSSASAMYDAAKRIKEMNDMGKSAVILYLGDHDPSGMDMDRDIRDRLEEMGADVNVERIGLTFEQIKKYNPPPNPAKMSDARADSYVKKYGRKCWEVDALNPETLKALVENKIEAIIDMDKFFDELEREKTDKKILKKLASKANYEDDDE